VQFRFSGVQNELQSALLKLVGAGSGAGGQGVVALPFAGLKVDMKQSLVRELKDVLHGVLVSREFSVAFATMTKPRYPALVVPAVGFTVRQVHFVQASWKWSRPCWQALLEWN